MTIRFTMQTHFFRIASLAALSLASAGCSDDDDDSNSNRPEETVEQSEGDGDSNEEPAMQTDDLDLLEWPTNYQEFIEEVGGSRYATVNGARMHYVQQGPEDGEVVLLIHGIPTHSFLWRKVLPELEGKRAIAVDLIGYGRSERPEGLDYTPEMQVEYLDAFVNELELDNVHLVVQDLGGVVGMRWAAETPSLVDTITMFETLWSTIPSLESVAPPFGGEGGMLDMMRDPETGPTLVGEQNIFLNSLSDFTLDGVSEADQAVYQYPWPSADERAHIFRHSGPLAFPFEDNPEAADYVRFYQDYLETSDVAKLVIDVTPGALSGALVPIDGEEGELVAQPVYAENSFPNVTSVKLEGSVHFAQEDIGPELGQAISTFVDAHVLARDE